MGLFRNEHNEWVRLANALAPGILVELQAQLALRSEQGHQVAQCPAVTEDAAAPFGQA